MSRFPDYEEYAERQARLDYANDRQRFPQVAASNATTQFDTALLLAWITEARQSLDAMEEAVRAQATHYHDAAGTVQLGHKATADAQRQTDEDAGGFARMVCGS